MTVTLQLKPEIEARAVQIALAQGKRIEDFLATVIETNLTKADDWRLETMREATKDELDAEEAELVAAGLMRLPTAEIPEDFWEMPAPRVSMDKIIAAIQADRDEG